MTWCCCGRTSRMWRSTAWSCMCRLTARLVAQAGGNKRLKVHLTVGEIHCAAGEAGARDHQARKGPLEFRHCKTWCCATLERGGSMTYVGKIINPKPVGDGARGGALRAVGGRGPAINALDGDYSFEHADLSTIQGIGGTLSSTGPLLRRAGAYHHRRHHADAGLLAGRKRPSGAAADPLPCHRRRHQRRYYTGASVGHAAAFAVHRSGNGGQHPRAGA